MKDVIEPYLKDLIDTNKRMHGLNDQLKKFLQQVSERTDRINQLKATPRIHYDSCTPMNEYYTGMYNGLLCAISIIDGRSSAEYKNVEASNPFEAACRLFLAEASSNQTEAWQKFTAKLGELVKTKETKNDVEAN